MNTAQNIAGIRRYVEQNTGMSPGSETEQDVVLIHIGQIEAELTALEAEMAMAFKLIRGIVVTVRGLSISKSTKRVILEMLERILTSPTEKDDKYVSPWGDEKPPTGRVLIDIEKLRKIQWRNEPEFRDGTHSSCIACDAWDDDGCKPDCWLDKLLKESDDGA